jgi:cell division protein FtsA
MFVSVDLGNSLITMMAAEHQIDGTFKIIAVEKEETPIDSIQNGIVRKPSEIASTISRLLKQMENRLENKLGNKYEIKNFYTAVNGRSLRSIRGTAFHPFETATEIGAAELNDLRRKALEQFDTNRYIYSITNEEYLIEGDYVRNPLNIVCREIHANYLVTMGRLDIRENLDKCIDRIVIDDVYSYSLAPIVMADALLTEDDRINGAIHLNFGATTTSVTVYQDNYLRHLAVVPFGGKHITNDLSTALSITLNEAELVKKQKGTPIIEKAKGRQISLPGKPGVEPRKMQLEEVSEIIEARLAEILNLAMKEVEASGFINKIKNGIVVSGATSRMTDFNEFIANKTNMEVRMGSLSHLVVGEYPDTTLEYPLLIGLLINADEPSVVEKPKETETSIQIEETLKPKGKKTSWFERFKQGSLFDGFDGPDGATIQD